MADIAWGSRYEFPVVTGDGGETPGGQGQQMVSCEVDDNKLVIAYVFVKIGASDVLDGRVLVATVDGEEVSYGDEYVFASPCLTQVNPVGLCKLDTNKFVVLHHHRMNGIASGPILARVGTVSGNTISFGASREIGEVEGISHWSTYLSCCSLGTDKFAVAYNDYTAGNKGMSTVCTVSGTTITTDEPVSLYDGRIRSSVCCRLTDDKFLVVYYQYMDARIYGRVATVSGRIPYFGSAKQLHDAMSRWQAVARLEDTKAVLSWNTGAVLVDYHGLAAILTISGTTITIGDKVETHAAAPSGSGPSHIDVVGLGANTFIHAFTDSSQLIRDPGLTQYSTIANSTITLGDKEQWDAGSVSGTNMFLVGGAGIFKLAVVYSIGLADYYTRIGIAAPYTPLVTTNPATSVLKVSALLHGTLDDDGGEACTCAFDWGLTTSYGDSVEVSTTRTTGQTFQGTATGLLPSTTYHFRAKATNSEGTGYGEDLTFTTEGGLYPAIATIRVSSLVHRWVPGSFTLDMVLGGLTSEFGLIVPTGKPTPTIPTLPSCQPDEVLSWSLERGYFCLPKADIPLGKY